jgi:methionyl-tRNA formyltransferase
MNRLRVGYIGYDFFSSCLAALIVHSNTEVVLCLTGEADDNVTNIVRLASSCGAALLIGRPSEPVIARMNEAKLDLLVCAGYRYRLPLARLSAGRAINVHPTLLPNGRGPSPLPYLVDGQAKFSGLSIHQMSPEFDRGPVLLQEPIEVAANDGFDDLAVKMFAVAPILLTKLLADVDGHFDRSREQGTGSYWPAHTREERTVVASRARIVDVEAANRKFGATGIVLALDDGYELEAWRLTASHCKHAYRPGTVAARLTIGTVIAVLDGLVRLDDPKWIST